jgi:hypothetical protein
MTTFRKALAAGIGALGTGLIAVASDGSITWVELVIVLGGTLVTGASTYRITNDNPL